MSEKSLVYIQEIFSVVELVIVADIENINVLNISVWRPP